MCFLKESHVVCLVSEHYSDDLEVDLEGFMLQDFNVELQDESARQGKALRHVSCVSCCNRVNQGSEAAGCRCLSL